MPLLDIKKVLKITRGIKYIEEYSTTKYPFIKGTKYRYYSNKALVESDCDVNVSVGGRKAGKSTDMCTIFVRDAVKYGHCFIFVRNRVGQVSGEKVVNYLQGHMRKDPIEFPELEPFNNFRVNTRKREVYIQIIDEEKGTLEEEVLVCTYRAVEQADYWRSTTLPENVYDKMFFEEFADEHGLSNAYNKLNTLLDTYQRFWKKGRFKLYMISNRTNMNNDYFTNIGVGDLTTQPVDTIRVYERIGIDPVTNEKIITRVALENVKNEGVVSQFTSGTGSGNFSGDEIETREYPLITPEHYKNASKCYQFYLEHGFRRHKATFFIKNGACYWLVEDFNADINEKNMKNFHKKRLITSNANMRWNVTHGLIGLTPEENNVFSYFSKGKVFYKSDKVGTTFNQDLIAIEKARRE